MARSRNIKPGLFKNEVLGVADPLLTLLFEGLWLLADREGRLEDRPLRIKAEVFPYRDGIDMEAMLNWLQSYGFIRRYEAQGRKCIAVLEFVRHQNPHKNEPESSLPAPDEIGATSEKIGSTRADSGFLIPDSGFLSEETVPSGPAPAPVEADEGPTLPTMAGAVCITLRAKGVQSVNPSHPDLLALLQGGVDIGAFAAAADKAVKAGKGSMAYVLATVKGQVADSQRMAANARASPQPQSRKDRQLETAALLTGATRPQPKPLDYIDADTRILPA